MTETSLAADIDKVHSRLQERIAVKTRAGTPLEYWAEAISSELEQHTTYGTPVLRTRGTPWESLATIGTDWERAIEEEVDGLILLYSVDLAPAANPSGWGQPATVWQRQRIIQSDIKASLDWLAEAAGKYLAGSVGTPVYETDPENPLDWWFSLPVVCSSSVKDAFLGYRTLIKDFSRTVPGSVRKRIRVDLRMSS
jgi:hypothetical protein